MNRERPTPNPEPLCPQTCSLARILEKQNRLQMSQVFPFPCIGDQMSLAFQGFYKRDRSTGKVTGFPLQLYMHAQIKKQPLPAVRQEVPGLLTLNKFRSRCERGRFAEPMLLPGGLATPIPRLSEARPR